LSRRYLAGVVPVARLNAVVMCAWLAKPHENAISASVMPVERSFRLAHSTRAAARYCMGVSPVTALNLRMK